jgi:hypothetical protein
MNQSIKRGSPRAAAVFALRKLTLQIGYELLGIG